MLVPKNTASYIIHTIYHQSLLIITEFFPKVHSSAIAVTLDRDVGQCVIQGKADSELWVVSSNLLDKISNRNQLIELSVVNGPDMIAKPQYCGGIDSHKITFSTICLVLIYLLI